MVQYAKNAAAVFRSNIASSGVPAVEVMLDHVRMFIEAEPTICVAEIVNRFKGRTSHNLRQEFAHLRSRMPMLWSRSYYAGTVGYYAGTVGNESAPVIRKYIESRKGR